MRADLHGMQHKRIMMLSASAIVFGLFAVYHLAGQAFASGFTWKNLAGGELYLLSACTLIICGVVTIATRSWQDDRVARYYAYHDLLTDLSNKPNLIYKLDKAIAKNTYCGGLLLVNIRRLSNINHSFGLQVGDEILRTSAKRLAYLFPEPNHIATIAPGTFAICVPGITRRQTVERLSEEISKAIKTPITIGTQSFYTETATGAVLFGGASENGEAIVRQGEMALMEAKNGGSHEVVIFNTSIQSRVEERGALETELREALEREQLETFFQPLVAEDGKTLLGFEALARWTHPQRGMISPGYFVPLAQNLNLTEVLGRQIMARACQQIRPLGDLKISVNVTPDHFLQPDFVNQIRKTLEQTGVAAHRLELEITESELISETERAAARIAELRQLGVSVALDDFGTGYSSLSYINKLAVDRIKIDASFVQEIETSEAARSMIRTIIEIASERGFSITAEGIETVAQFEFLKQFPGLTYQGYLFSPPMHYRDVLESSLLERHDVQRFARDRRGTNSDGSEQALRKLAAAG